jgi:4-amino-4-deoxy-L-arabinose transferase-like glycosyltransferase
MGPKFHLKSRSLLNCSAQQIAFVLLFVAFSIRLAAALALRGLHEEPNYNHGFGDGPAYHRLAYRIALGQGYISDSGKPTAFVAPGFPFFLAGIYALAGLNYPLVYLALCALGALSCLLAYLLAREVISEYFARWAGLLGALYLPHIHFSTLYYSEALFVPCLGLGLWLFVRHLKSGQVWQLVVAALILGFGALIRPFTFLFYPVLGLLLIAKQPGNWRLIGAKLLLLVAGICCVIVLWSVRNRMVFGKNVPITTHGGATFRGGNNDLVLNRPLSLGWASWVDLPHLDEILAAPDEVERDKIQWRLGMDWLRTHASAVPRLLVFKLSRLWLPDLKSPSRPYKLSQIIGYTPFLILFILGCLRSLLDRRCWTLAWAAYHSSILATIATALIFRGAPRFRDANVPVLMSYASMGLAVIDPKRRNAVGSID